ncbi:hypothetical protein CEQ90_17605 [Lewinellaceae bacterium SD302]|nr:hypothetical protein CEQ90_17605 [Lewinellaceae bacterium SD302]
MIVSLTDLFIIASLIQGAFLGVAILSVGYFRSPANYYLGWSLLLLSGIQFLGWQDLDIDFIDWLWAFMWEYLFIALIVSYFLKALKHPLFESLWRRWLFAPFLVSLAIDLFVAGGLYLNLYEVAGLIDSGFYQFYEIARDQFALWFNAVGLITVSIITWQYREPVPSRRRWLLRFCAAMLGIICLWFVANFADDQLGLGNAYTVVWLAVGVFFWWVAYTGVYQMRVLDEQLEIRSMVTENLLPNAPAGSVETTPVKTFSPLEKYAIEIQQLMAKKRLFSNPDLSRQVVADELGVSEGYVSRVMSEEIGERFADYVNRFRAEEARRLLMLPQFDRYSLEAIGLEAGFRSRSAFYSVFKKATGSTPGEFRKNRKVS